MGMRTLSATAFALLIGVAAPAAAQVAPLTDQSFMSVTVVGNVEANKALGWLWGSQVSTHLKRQSGVTDATYRNGTIEVRSEGTQGFRIGEIVKVVTTEIGVTPVKRIEAVIRGRVVPGGKTLEVAGTGERLLIDGRKLAEGSEQVWRGVILPKGKGDLTFRPTTDQ